MGATCLPELVSLYYGINYYEMIVKNALGEDPRQVFDRRAAQETPNASRFITADRTGVLRGITNNNAPASDIAMLELYAKAGTPSAALRTAKTVSGRWWSPAPRWTTASAVWTRSRAGSCWTMRTELPF